ncbi:MAG: hypothetical protein ACXWLH_04205 [Candidatus Saccharimonadales bacterium]
MRYTKYSFKTGAKTLRQNGKAKLSSILLGFGLVGAAVAVPIIVSAANPTPPVEQTVVVTKQTMANNISDVISKPTSWFFYNDETDSIDSTLGTMVNGPDTPPLGMGSAQISVSGTQRRNLATYQFSGTKLADITELKFSTYNSSAGNGGSANRSGYLNFNVDFNGSDTWQNRLVFLPIDNGTIHQNQWDTWDAVNGGNALYRYSGSVWPGTSTSGDTPRTLSDLISFYPGIRIRVTDSWLGIRVGEPYADGYTENIDNFIFGTASKVTTFDFEFLNHPTKNLECTHNGWQNFNYPTFSSEQECKQWVHGVVAGQIWLSGPSQEVDFNANNNPELVTTNSPKKGKVHYINYDFAGGPLEYSADIICTNANPATDEARFMYQIPAGYPGLSGLYVVMDVTKGNLGSSDFGFAATSSLNTATQWCQTGVGFSPTSYNVTRGWVKVTY